MSTNSKPSCDGIESGPWDGRVRWVALAELSPPHEPDEPQKVKSLAASMSREGWVGRPLLVVDYGEPPLMCLTGSHRWAAARRACLSQVPIVLVDLSSCDDPNEDLETSLPRCADPQDRDAVNDLFARG